MGPENPSPAGQPLTCGNDFAGHPGIVLTRTARRQLAEELPEPVAAAAWELIQGDMRAKPQIVGRPLLEPYAGEWSARRGTYRIRYRFDDKTVTVRRDAASGTRIIHQTDYSGNPVWPGREESGRDHW